MKGPTVLYPKVAAAAIQPADATNAPWSSKATWTNNHQTRVPTYRHPTRWVETAKTGGNHPPPNEDDPDANRVIHLSEEGWNQAREAVAANKILYVGASRDLLMA